MKSVRLFLKDHIPFLLFQGFLVFFLLLLFWLDGFRNYSTVIYGVILSVLFSSVFLLGKFVLRRSFYVAITKRPEKMEDALIRHIQGPEHRETADYMRTLYKIYQHEVQTLYAAQNRQLEFINQWVHQMKTPISVMGLLLQEEKVDEESIAEEVERIRTGLESVLVNARLETFEQDMNIEKVSLKTLVQNVVTEYKRLFITKGVFPVFEITEDFIIATDVKWMEIVLGQFITNAVKYSFESGKKIYLDAEEEEGRVLFTIRDEGVGIPSSDLKRVTRAFFTGENGRLTGESTGMGLYIAKEVCTRLGHSFHIDSIVGTGTTVSILFENVESREMDDGKTNYRAVRSDEDL